MLRFGFVRAVLMACLGSLAAAAPAAALTTVDNPGGGAELVITAAPGVSNDGLGVTYLPDYGVFQIKEQFGSDNMAVTPAAAPRCTIPLQPNVNCAVKGITAITIHAGDGNDRIFIQRAPYLEIYRPVPAGVSLTIDLGTGRDEAHSGLGDDTLTGGPGVDFLDGAEGADVVSGGPGADIVKGGPGADSMFGGSGNDALFARDHVRDTRIACGSGRHDEARVDRRSPADPRTSGCEG